MCGVIRQGGILHLTDRTMTLSNSRSVYRNVALGKSLLKARGKVTQTSSASTSTILLIQHDGHITDHEQLNLQTTSMTMTDRLCDQRPVTSNSKRLHIILGYKGLRSQHGHDRPMALLYQLSTINFSVDKCRHYMTILRSTAAERWSLTGELSLSCS